MKEKRIWQRWLCVVLGVALLSTLPGTALAVGEKEEWTAKNSMQVNVTVEESRSFSPEDFPGIECRDVYVLGKKQVSQGIDYYLLVILKTASMEEMRNALEEVKKLPMVNSARFTNEYTPRKAVLALNHSCVHLAVNETVDISIKKYKQQGTVLYEGVGFTPDPEYFNLDSLQKNSFLSYGISHFWPDIEGIGDLIVLSGYRDEELDELEAQKSESGIYYGLAGEESENLFETVAALASAPEILNVSIVQSIIVGATRSNWQSERWELENSDIASCSLSGGEPEEKINQTAKVCGLKPGVTTITCERGTMKPYASAGCTIIVYEPGSKNNPGDMDHDGAVGTDDALQALKHAVGLISLDETAKKTADLNQDNLVDERDALLMLKIAGGIL